MHSVCRAALRCAATAARSAAIARPLTGAPATARVRQSAIAANASASLAVSAARYFSQTARALSESEEKKADEATGEAAEATPVEEASEATPAAETETAAAAATEAPAASESASPFSSEPNEFEAPLSSSSAPPAPSSGGNNYDETPYGIFIRNVVFDATEQHLQEAFEHYGPVAKTVVARDARGLSRGYAFVYFENEADMKKAMEESNGSFWHGRRIVVQPRAPRANRGEGSFARGGNNNGRNGGNSYGNGPSNREPTSSLYIGNLPYETTDADLNDLFRGLNGVKMVRVAVDRNTGWPRGFAHVDFASVEDATAAHSFFSNRTVGTRQLRVDYSNPDPKRAAARMESRSQGQPRGVKRSEPSF